jgi:cell division protein FtsI (penicillin-binding protein 3)
VKSTFREELKKDSASGGFVIIMDVHTGQVLSSVGFRSNDGGSIVEDTAYTFLKGGDTPLMLPISALTAIESGRVSMEDSVNAGCGVIEAHGRYLYDHNWRCGGYGMLSLLDGVKCGSNITVYKAVDKAYGSNPKLFYDALNKMDYGKPDSVNGIGRLERNVLQTNYSGTSLVWNLIGYHQRISPLQMLAFYNAFANGGKMVSPTFEKGETRVINPRIADKQYVNIMLKMFDERMNSFMSPVGQAKPIRGYGGSLKSNGLSYSSECGQQVYDKSLNNAEFCGFWPITEPKYIVISSIQKYNYPLTWRYNYEYTLKLMKYLK